MSTPRKAELARQLSLPLQYAFAFAVPRGCRHQAHLPCDVCAPMVRTPEELREVLRAAKAAQNVTRASSPARASRPGRQSPKPKRPKLGVKRPPASRRKRAPPRVEVEVSASM